MHHHDNPTGHMRPRQVRRILALMWLGAVLAAAAVLILAPKSHALNICGLLASSPTTEAVNTIALGLVGNGLTPYQAGQVIGSAVVVGCPEYWPVLQNYARQYARKDSLA